MLHCIIFSKTFSTKPWECGGKRWIPFPFLEIINSQSVKEHLTRSHVCSNIPAWDWLNIFCLLFKTTPITTISYILITTDGRGTSPEQRWKLIQVFRHFHLKILAFSLVYISCSVQNTVVTILFFLETFSGRRRRLWTDGRGQGKLVWSQATLRFNSSLGFCNWICTKKINLWTYICLSSSLCKKLFPCLVVWK